MEVIGYLGPEGSYSHLAAEAFRPDAKMRAYPSFRLCLEALLSGKCDVIALPIENSLNGAVSQNLDILQSAENVIAFEERTVNIDHRLATLSGADKTKITRVFSHRQALEQCGEYLFKNFPQAKLIAAPSTAASLDMVEKETDACIVGAHVKRAGFTLSDGNIADEKCNLTHFLLVKRGGAQDCGHSKKIYFCATCKHEPGALLKLLMPLSSGGLNMTKIESRPIKDRLGEYRFFIEIEGDYADAEVQGVLKGVKAAANYFKILGLY